MLYFFGAVALLIGGYFTYGVFVERVFGTDDSRVCPCDSCFDGVDYTPMPAWKVFFIQLLDIAGLGPIIGPIMGALYGPVAMIWMVVGTIVAGGVHDYFSGMLSLRNKGQSISEVVGDYMGPAARQAMRLFSLILLLLVGVVFVLGPAKLLSEHLGGFNVNLLIAIIFAYYFLATILPIDKIIGQLYPVFGLLLLFMSFGVIGGLIWHGYDLVPNHDFTANFHPGNKPIWPLLFITISCGALSGFHSTQSPLMARCMTRESLGRPIFYGAMICEGIIALIWCCVGMAFYESPTALNAALSGGGWASIVSNSCNSLLGVVGGFLAIMGVIVLPITSGDTAFRSARLIIADTLKMPQAHPLKRLYIAVPLFIVAFAVSQVNFNIIWRYFGWSNQMLSTVVLWSGAIYLAQRARLHWICTVPATFMTAVVTSFILQSEIGFQIPAGVANIIGVAAAAIALGLFLWGALGGKRTAAGTASAG